MSIWAWFSNNPTWNPRDAALAAVGGLDCDEIAALSVLRGRIRGGEFGDDTLPDVDERRLTFVRYLMTLGKFTEWCEYEES